MSTARANGIGWAAIQELGKAHTFWAAPIRSNNPPGWPPGRLAPGEGRETRTRPHPQRAVRAVNRSAQTVEPSNGLAGRGGHTRAISAPPLPTRGQDARSAHPSRQDDALRASGAPHSPPSTVQRARAMVRRPRQRTTVGSVRVLDARVVAVDRRAGWGGRSPDLSKQRRPSARAVELHQPLCVLPAVK